MASAAGFQPGDGAEKGEVIPKSSERAAVGGAVVGVQEGVSKVWLVLRNWWTRAGEVGLMMGGEGEIEGAGGWTWKGKRAPS